MGHVVVVCRRECVQDLEEVLERHLKWRAPINVDKSAQVSVGCELHDHKGETAVGVEVDGLDNIRVNQA